MPRPSEPSTIQKKPVIIFVLIASVISYLLLEVGMYLALSFGFHFPFSPLQNSRYFNRPAAKFNKLTGYTWLPGESRVMRTMYGELIYDQVFRANNMGFTALTDYTFRRNPDETARIIVFGDSFTDSIFLETTWPERLQEILDSNKKI